MRYILKVILKYLSKWAISKHNLELIVVTGWTGVDLTKEGIYTILSDKYLVRRNIKPIWWDLSIPLTILGYPDKKRNVFEWIDVITKSIFVLLFGPVSPIILILSADAEDESTAIYWKKFIQPDYLVIMDNKRKSQVTSHLIEGLKDTGAIIYNPEELKSNFANKVTYGEKEEVDVQYSEFKSSIIIKYKNYSVKLPETYYPSFVKKVFAACVALSISKGMKFEDIVNELLKFDLSNSILQKISEKLSE